MEQERGRPVASYWGSSATGVPPSKAPGRGATCHLLLPLYFYIRLGNLPRPSNALTYFAGIARYCKTTSSAYTGSASIFITSSQPAASFAMVAEGRAVQSIPASSWELLINRQASIWVACNYRWNLVRLNGPSYRKTKKNGSVHLDV